MRRLCRCVVADRRGSTALETTVMLPLIISVMVALVGVYQVLSSRRAVEYGLEAALRFVAVRSATATQVSIAAAYAAAASALSSDVGTNSSVNVTPASGFQPGQIVQIAVTYQWTPPAAIPLFPAIPMNRTASITVVN